MGEIVRIADAVKPKTYNKQAKVKLAQDLIGEKSVCMKMPRCCHINRAFIAERPHELCAAS